MTPRPLAPPGWRLPAIGVLAGSLLLAATSPALASDTGLGYAPATTKGSLYQIAQAVGAHDAYNAGYTGRGVGIALIDTGVTEVPGLSSGNVFHGPDLSFDSQDPELRYKDGYGHGTHLASIIVGRDLAGQAKTYTDPTRFTGIAPDADLISIKVGAQDGAVDVSQVIAALNWVVEHRNDGPSPIRVVNLSYGTDGVQDYMVDPLVHAAENAVRAGITVVAAAGNDGKDTFLLANPAMSPNVFAVGTNDTQGTPGSTGDDVVPVWASRGTDKRHVDLVAPGVSVHGLRVPGGYADEHHPEARVGTRFAKASGTSQSAAVVTGQVALLQQKHGGRLSPEQVRVMLTGTAWSLSKSSKYSGKGQTRINNALGKSVPTVKGSAYPYGNGTGSLEAARGTSHVWDGVSELRGEVDTMGRPWDGRAYAAAADAGTVWSGRAWRGTDWTGDGWNGRAWRGIDWTSGTWSGRAWRDSEWLGRAWREGTWSGRAWREANWSGRAWRTADLASNGWS